MLALETEFSHQNSSYKVKINQFSSDHETCKALSPPEKLMTLNGCWRWVSFSLKMQSLRDLDGGSRSSEGKEVDTTV